MQNQIKSELTASAALKTKIAAEMAGQIEQAAKIMIDALKNGKKIMFMGNGGSAADAQHLAAELVGRFLMDRKALPSIALTTDTSILTALGNDFGFNTIYKRQVEALGQSGDVLVSLSSSGKSENLVEALKAAKEKGLKTISFSGKSGGPADKASDLSLVIPSNDTPRIQEAQIAIGHILCGLIEKEVCNG
jgi:D-sedoheptulose 7-phosphate isomerase